MQSGKHFLFIFLNIIRCSGSQTNFILNSDFQLPRIGGYYRQVPISYWRSYLIQIRNATNFQCPEQNGQIIHLGTGQDNGYIQQSVNLPFQAICLLEFDIKKSSQIANNNSFRLQVGWNGKQIASCFNLRWTVFQTYSFSLNGNTGVNTLRFQEVGSLDYYATYIDNVRLNCTENENENKQAKSPLQQFISKIDSAIDGDNRVPSSIVTLSCFKISPKFLISLFMTFDDFEFYSFHNYRYPRSAQIFFDKAYLIQRERLNPKMLSAIQILQSEVSFAQQNSQVFHQLFKLQSLKNQQLFFLKFLLNRTRSHIFIALLLYLGLKMFKFILYIVHTKFVIGSFIYEQVSKLSQFWIMALSVFESFSSKFGFHFGIQTCLSSYNEFLDKANMFISTSIFFVFVIYSLFGYLLVLKFKGKQKSKTLLYSFKFKNLSYIYQCVFFVLRGLIRSFIHGFLITNHQYQILALFLVSVIYFIVCFPLKRHFANPFLFALYSTYMLAFVIFDFYFVLESRLLISYFDNDRQMFALIMVAIIIFVSLLLFSTFFIKWVIKILKLMKKIRIKFSNNLTSFVENQQQLNNKQRIIEITNYCQKQRRKNTDEQYSPGLFSGQCSVTSIKTLHLNSKPSKPATEQTNTNQNLEVVEKKDISQIKKSRNVQFVQSIKDIDMLENN